MPLELTVQNRPFSDLSDLETEAEHSQRLRAAVDTVAADASAPVCTAGGAVARPQVWRRECPRQIAASASDLVTTRPRAPYSCRSPNISMRMAWSRPPTRTGS